MFRVFKSHAQRENINEIGTKLEYVIYVFSLRMNLSESKHVGVEKF
jgi:hypothetical protein